MLSRNAQVVIGIAVIILAAAFLLVGIYFAQLQGVFLQNGADSISIFGANLGAIQNALYSAPSSMRITLSGNNSLCQWSAATDKYNCAGGSDIRNISYASGPTLDVGTAEYSFAICFMLSVGPKSKPGPISVGTDAERMTLSASDKVLADTLPEVENLKGSAVEQSDSFITQDGAYAMKAGKLGKNEIASTRFTSADYVESNDQFIGALSPAVKKGVWRDATTGKILSSTEVENRLKNAETITVDVPNSLLQMARARGNGVLAYIKYVANNVKNNFKQSIVKSAIRFGLKGITFSVAFLSAATVVNSLTNGFHFDQYVTPLSGNSLSNGLEVVSSYQNQQPLPPQLTAFDLELDHYVQQANLSGQYSNLGQSYYAQDQINTAVQSAQLSQDLLGEFSNSSTSYNPYSTPQSGVSVKSNTLSSNSAFINNIPVNGIGDPLLSTVALVGRTGLMVAARTATCLGDLPTASSLTSSGSNLAMGALSEYGALTTLFDVYFKQNAVQPLGSYFIGYGGEVYLEGQANGRATVASTPVITDLADICTQAETTPPPGNTLKSLLLPEGNGSLSFAISQGLFNTECPENNLLFPHTLAYFVNEILSTSSSKNVSILLPSYLGLGIYSPPGGSYSALCIYNLITDDNGAPIYTTSSQVSGAFVNAVTQNNITEFGTAISCINLTNMTGGKNSIKLINPYYSSATTAYPQYYINNNSILDFSSPLSSDSNYIPGPPDIQRSIVGVEVLPGLSNIPGANTVTNFINSHIQTNAFTSLYNGFAFPSGPSESFYPTEYSNITFQVTSSGSDFTLTFLSNNNVFGVDPNTPSTTLLGYNYNTLALDGGLSLVQTQAGGVYTPTVR